MYKNVSFSASSAMQFAFNCFVLCQLIDEKIYHCIYNLHFCYYQLDETFSHTFKKH